MPTFVRFTEMDLMRARAHDQVEFLWDLKLEQWRARGTRLGHHFWIAHMGRTLHWLGHKDWTWKTAWLEYFTACAAGQEPERTPDAPEFTEEECLDAAELYRLNVH